MQLQSTFPRRFTWSGIYFIARYVQIRNISLSIRRDIFQHVFQTSTYRTNFTKKNISVIIFAIKEHFYVLQFLVVKMQNVIFILLENVERNILIN